MASTLRPARSRVVRTGSPLTASGGSIGGESTARSTPVRSSPEMMKYRHNVGLRRAVSTAQPTSSAAAANALASESTAPGSGPGCAAMKVSRSAAVDDRLPRSTEFGRNYELRPRVNQQRAIDDRSNVVRLTLTEHKLVRPGAIFAVSEIESRGATAPPQMGSRRHDPESCRQRQPPQT